MAGDFKMHRGGPRRNAPGAGVGGAPLGRQPKRPVGRARLARLGDVEADKDGAPPRPVQGPVQVSVQEIGGPKGPEPTRYGDWERNGICYDF